MLFLNEPHFDATEDNPLRFLEFAFSYSGVHYIHEKFEFTQITDEWGGLPVYDKTRDFNIYNYFDERIGKYVIKEYFFWDEYKFLVNNKVKHLMTIIDKIVIKLMSESNIKTFFQIIIGRVKSILNTNQNVDSIDYNNVKSSIILDFIDSLHSKYFNFIEIQNIKISPDNYLKLNTNLNVNSNILLLQKRLLEYKFIEIANSQSSLITAMSGKVNSKSMKILWIFKSEVKNKTISKIPLLYLIRNLIKGQYINEFSNKTKLYSALDNS
ncbi:MAG TPA: hypothetical protein PLD02_15890, partial [Saprospiraceae bacterium]|nr:hypothetical protein [Saprospiraceae bacterium]